MDANSEKKIKVLPNGPYEVIGDIPLNQLRYVNDRKGASTGYKGIQKYAPEGVYHLCRCGGSHKERNFLGKKSSPPDPSPAKSLPGRGGNSMIRATERPR